MTIWDEVMSTYQLVRNKGNAPKPDNVFIGQGLVAIMLLAVNTQEPAAEGEQRWKCMEMVPEDMGTLQSDNLQKKPLNCRREAYAHPA